MAKASKNMPDLSQRSAPAVDTEAALSTRCIHEVRKSTLDEKLRTIEADLTTEAAVDMPDYVRGAMVPEVLLASGAQLPKNRQVPLLDSHNRGRVSDQLGSVRNVQVADGGRVTGTLHFAGQADREFQMVREGHISDVSAGYRVLKSVHIAAGESRNVAGRSFTGPVNVVTKWRLDEVSLVPIGADSSAKLRSLSNEGFVMDQEVFDALVKRGMPATYTHEQAKRWMLDNAFATIPAAGTAGATTPPAGNGTPGTAPADGNRGAGGGTATITDDQVNAIANRIAEATVLAERQVAERRNQHRLMVRGLCELAQRTDLFEEAAQLETVAKVQEFLLARQKQDGDAYTTGVHVVVGEDARDNLVRDMGNALVMRCAGNVGPSDEVPQNEWHEKQIIARRERARKIVIGDLEKPEIQRGWSQFSNASMYQMAEDMLRSLWGINTRNMTRDDVAMIAMFGPDRAREMGIRFKTRGAAYHTTGSFANLTLDAVNKSMMLGYQEAPSTWQGPMRQGASVDDFKNIHRLQLGAIGNLPVWNDSRDPEVAGITDSKETYAVEARSITIDFSYRLLVNDDIGGLSRIPAQLGNAARRTVNAVAWSQVTANANMGDGVALFAAATGARKRTNLTTGAGTPSVSTVQTLTNLMMQMRGNNTPEGNEGPDLLALMPRYIIGPSALYTTIMQLVLSAWDPSSANQSYNTASRLIPVIEPLLDASSTTAWYLFADPSQIETIEVTFLRGQETPALRTYLDPMKLAQSYTILQSFNAKPLNHRGVQKHAGA